MRFLLKIGFWLALIAFFLPVPGGGDPEREGVNAFGALIGAQQALSDMGGFCERAPAACEAGRDVGTYVAARVGEGLAYGFAAVREQAVATPEPTLAEPAIEVSPAQPASARPALDRPVIAPSAPASAAPALAQRAAAPDPMQTAAVAADYVRRTAGLEPFSMPGLKPQSERASGPRPAAFVHAGNARSIPLPTPRP